MRDLGIVLDGAVAIDRGVIIDVGQTSALCHKYQPLQELDAQRHIVLPGFVDPHTHAVYAGDRLNEFELRIKGASYLEIMASGGGINSTARATRQSSLSELVDTSYRSLEKMFRLGATTVEVKTGYGLDLAIELKLLAAIAALDEALPLDLVPTFLPAHAIPPEFTGRSSDYVDLIVEVMIPAAVEWYRKSHFARANRPYFIDVFCEQKAFSVAESQRVLAAGRANGMGVKAHVDEFTNLGGVRMALALGATSIDHLDTITAEEIAMIAVSPTIAVISPAVNFNFGSTCFANARALIDKGAAVALTTDFNPGSAPCLSLPLVMAIACRYCHLLPAEALNAVTINAAHAVGMGELVGSIEVGKQADMLIADVSDYRQLAYELGANPIQTVIKRGKVVSSFTLS